MKIMYKVTIVKLVLVVAGLTTVVVLGSIYLINYFLQKNTVVVNNTKEKIVERLKQGVVEEKKEITPAEAILNSVNANRTRVVKIYQKLTDDSINKDNTKSFLARGVILSQDGFIVTAGDIFKADKQYSIIIPGRKDIFTLKPILVNDKLAFFKVDSNLPLVVKLKTLKPKIGDLVVAIGGQKEDGLASGKIIAVKDILKFSVILTTIPVETIKLGTPLLNTNKEVIGIFLKKNEKGQSLFIPSKNIKNNWNKIK